MFQFFFGKEEVCQDLLEGPMGPYFHSKHIATLPPSHCGTWCGIENLYRQNAIGTPIRNMCTRMP